MELKPGAKLGPYEIVSAIGKGGMGEVWKARDPRLGREVAIKVSAQQFTDRFEREARAIAALNHSNICTLYDVGQNYLVMEFVAGPTLAERIAEGPIPLEEALPIAKQIADALEAAHEKGIVHRDLKPANVKIRPDGSVKVLDFGLAKSAEYAEATADSPTIMSVPGMILGTAGYMSPEQARGKEVDKRADIWAYGVVLYEMVTAKRLFEGETVSDTLAAILTRNPDLSLAPDRTLQLLQRCLEKDPKRRLRDIGDAMPLLEVGVGPAATRRGRLAWFAATAVLAIALAISLWAPWGAQKQVDRPLVRLDVDLGTDVLLPAPGIGGSVAISPDGTRLAYISGTSRKLFIRRLDQLKATELPGVQGAYAPFFSPDGQWVAFEAGGKLYKISVEGGAAVPLGDIGGFSGASWGADGNILAGEAYGKGVVRIPAAGGNSETIVSLGTGELTLAYPQILPGGKAVLFSTYRVFDVDKINVEVITLADRHRRVLVRGGTSARYLATSGRVGHLLYVNKATLFAIPFDPDKLETRGVAVPLLDDIGFHSGTASGQLDFSRTGTLVYRRAGGTAAPLDTLQWVEPTGAKVPLSAKPGVLDYPPAVSPDGKRIAMSVTQGGSTDIWVYDQQRDTTTRLTFGGEFYRYPTWSPDGQYVVFARRIGGGIFQARADGAGQPQALTQSNAYQMPASFTPDGKRLAYYEGGRSQIWTLPVEDQGGRLKGGQPEQFLKSTFDDDSPELSPDGHWLAYYSNESGKYEVYVRPFPPPSSGQGGKWQISNNGGRMPRWSRNGHELLYQSGDQIMAASYTAQGETFVPAKPRVWFAKVGGTEWDLDPDGKRVLVVTPVESAEAPKPEHEVVFLENFFDELRRRVPANK